MFLFQTPKMKLCSSVLILLSAVVYVFAQSDDSSLLCIQDVNDCGDGTWVGRDPDNNCEWLPCPVEPMLCIQDVTECDDGTWVGRDPDNNCEFVPCPAEPMACTEEAMLCADGSSVSRNPYNGCKFNPCPEDPIACTADAKICPDGSGVGRDPHNGCEFYPCPEGGGGVCSDWFMQDWSKCADQAVPNMCSEDDECMGEAVCCEVECGGHDCVMPEPTCPADISDSEVDGCESECKTHDNCAMMYGSDNMACCWNGCAQRCVYGGGHSGAPKAMLASIAVILVSLMTNLFM